MTSKTSLEEKKGIEKLKYTVAAVEEQQKHISNGFIDFGVMYNMSVGRASFTNDPK